MNPSLKDVVPQHWPCSPYRAEDCATLTQVVPIEDTRELSVTWSIPDLREHYKSSPTKYLSRLIHHEGEGSLFSELKARSLINWIYARRVIGARGFHFLKISVDLTEDGIQKIPDILMLIFQYLALLKSEGPQRWFFEECLELGLTRFRYQDKEEPQDYVSELAEDLADFPVEDVLIGSGRRPEDWRPELISDLLSCLTPSKARVLVTGKMLAEKCTETEPWFGTKYSFEKFPQENIQAWTNCSLNQKLALPKEMFH